MCLFIAYSFGIRILVFRYFEVCIPVKISKSILIIQLRISFSKIKSQIRMINFIILPGILHRDMTKVAPILLLHLHLLLKIHRSAIFIMYNGIEARVKGGNQVYTFITRNRCTLVFRTCPFVGSDLTNNSSHFIK